VAQFAKLPLDLEWRIHAACSALSMKDRQNFDSTCSSIAAVPTAI
jgi:hypothetical protein